MKRKSLAFIVFVLALVLVALGALTSCGEHKHTWYVDAENSIQATCINEGYQREICAVCGEDRLTRTPKQEHTFGDWIAIREVTCMLHGLEERACTECGYKEQRNVDPTYMHTWGNWVVSIEPGCDSEGLKSRACTICMQSETVYIDKLGHTFSTELVYDKYTHWYPTTCGHEDVKGVEEFHQFTEWQDITPATCTEPGQQTRSCKTCAYTEERVQEPYGHQDFLGGKWFSDYTGHWNKCHFCTYKMNFAAHIYENGVCTTCAYAPTIEDILILTLKSDGTYSVDGVRIHFAEIVIPAEIDDIAVTEIGKNAFKGATYLTALTLPEGITKIGNSAFSGCTGLTRLALPSTITDINASAFSGCTALASINLPVGITKLPTSVFDGCEALTTIEIPEGVTSIGMLAFDGCASLATVSLPSTLTSISGMAFSGCASLTAIEIPEGITEIVDSTFEGCSALASVTLPSTITYIGASSFAGCVALTEITIPAAVAEIGSGAFLGAGLTHAYFEAKATIWELTDSKGEPAPEESHIPSDKNAEETAALLRENAYTWKKG